MSDEQDSLEEQSEMAAAHSILVKGPDDLSRTDIKQIYDAAGIGLDFIGEGDAAPEKRLDWCLQVLIGIQEKLAAGNTGGVRPALGSCSACVGYVFGSSAWQKCIMNKC